MAQKTNTIAPFKILQEHLVLLITSKHKISYILKKNIKHKGNIPLATYIDFETTALINKFRSRKQENVCDYFALHPELNINRGIIERSFGHSKEKLTSLNYLNLDQPNNKSLL